MTDYGEPWGENTSNPHEVLDVHGQVVAASEFLDCAQIIHERVNACEGVTFKGDPSGSVRELVELTWRRILAGSADEIVIIDRDLKKSLARFTTDGDS